MVSYITMILFRVARCTARAKLQCLLIMTYCIRTVFGDSELYYGGDKWERAPTGNGQGNGTGPSLWAGTSSLLFDILREQGYRIHLQAPISETAMHITGFGSVDNADLIQGAGREQSIQDLLRYLQRMINLWEEVLWVTGGALGVKEKSDWTLISFEWKREYHHWHQCQFRIY